MRGRGRGGHWGCGAGDAGDAGDGSRRCQPDGRGGQGIFIPCLGRLLASAAAAAIVAGHSVYNLFALSLFYYSGASLYHFFPSSP